MATTFWFEGEVANAFGFSSVRMKHGNRNENEYGDAILYNMEKQQILKIIEYNTGLHLPIPILDTAFLRRFHHAINRKHVSDSFHCVSDMFSELARAFGQFWHFCTS